MAAPTIAGLLEALGIDASDGQRDALRRYLGELELWNRKRDLVKAEGSALLTRHLADSLAGLETVRGELERAAAAHAAAGGAAARGTSPGGAFPGATLLDLGAGGGFPGIPLSVFLPDTRVVLVDRSGWKCSFLKSAAAVAGLGNVEVRHADYRDLATVRSAQPAGAAPVPAAVIVFRAFAGVDAGLAEVLARMLVPGGAVVAYKGRYDNAALEAKAARPHFAEVELVPVAVPELKEERTLLILRSSAGSS